MAYVFSNLRSSMDDDKAGQANIFDQPEQQGQPQQGGQQQGQSSQTKTSTAGELGSAGPASNQASSEQGPKDVRASSNDVVRRNVGKAQAPKRFQDFRQNLTQAQQSFQDEADSYVKNAEAQDYSVGADQIEAAISGDEEASSLVGSRLSGQVPDQYDAFDVNDEDYLVRDIGKIKSDSGVRDLLARESGPQYNAGESAFDMMLLNRNPEFRLIRDQLVRDQDSLLGNIQTQESDLTEQARKIQEERYGQASQGVRDYLSGASDSVMSDLEARAKAENELRKKMDLSGFAEEQSSAIMDELLKQYQKQDPRLIEMLRKAGVDASKFAKSAGDVGWEDLVTADDATRFNRIMGLLGQEDSLQAGGGAGPREVFQSDAFRDAVLKSAKGLRAKEDKRLQGEIDKIIARLNSKAEQDRQAFLQAGQGGGGYGAGPASEIDYLKGILGDDFFSNIANQWGEQTYSSDELRGNANTFLEQALSGLNARDYVGDIGWESYLSQKDIDQINALRKELGQGKAKYRAGGGLSGAVDRKGLEKAILDSLAQQHAAWQASQPSGSASSPGSKAAGNPNWGESLNPFARDDKGKSNASKWGEKAASYF